MLSFVRFHNNTNSAAISVMLDGMTVCRGIIAGVTSPYVTVDAGTHNLTVLQKNDRPYIGAVISLPIEFRSTVSISENEIIVSLGQLKILPPNLNRSISADGQVSALLTDREISSQFFKHRFFNPGNLYL